jgi:hypothetical protein
MHTGTLQCVQVSQVIETTVMATKIFLDLYRYREQPFRPNQVNAQRAQGPKQLSCVDSDSKPRIGCRHKREPPAA